MAKSKYSPSETKYKRWIKEGRGNGSDYLPWITVRDVPSDGRSHRVFGHTSPAYTSDFLIDSTDQQSPQYVIQAKRSETLQDPRIIEKLEIERRYWLLKKVPWFLVTENDVSPTLVQNISCIYPAEQDEIDDEVLLDRTAYYSDLFQQNPNKTVTDICKLTDRIYNQPDGSSIYEIRQLLSNRCFYFDMLSQPFHLLKGKDFVVENMGSLIGARHVSNQ
ncbi:TnsA endonuclease N-terminal domain-containing protein [Vibrio alginolyticus]|uniref:TnsA endonuclease N-terminal domain-containing protein n=1 Tax=Vibrio alginolyticus TaxID=663 RepID=UPI001EFE9A71|nr:TnsA endonuclease N-terminal domain-containing protein [Vibrio alginolyticus]MCG9766650.1 TnsA endonuclease N-terminal domain-containing protein [Vibrio alginolyticus]